MTPSFVGFARCQWGGREKLFEREQETHPDFDVWDCCAMACEAVKA